MAYFARPQSRSAAVKIVAPSTEPLPDDAGSQKSAKKDSTQRQCRNILIHGFCKYEGKGCVYYHPSRADAGTPAPQSEAQSAPGQPTNAPGLPAQAVNAPVFVPRSVTAASPPPAEIQRPDESPSPSAGDGYLEYNPYDPYAYPGGNGEFPPTHMMEGLANQLQSLDTGEYLDGTDQHMLLQSDYNHPDAMDAYYHSQPTFVRQPLNYHLYTQALPRVPAHNFFISDDIREELTNRSEISRTAPAPGLILPEEVSGYHSLVPLEAISGERRKFGNWYTSMYRATSSADGGTYALRRVESFRLNNQAAFGAIETWSRIRHPNIASVREAFTTVGFNDNSLVVVYDYHPNAQTLFEAHLKPRAPVFQHGRVQHQAERVPERTLWSYICQIASAIKAVHEAGLAVRLIDATKILVTGQNRIRVGSCGILDVLLYDTPQDVTIMQQDDLTMFARLLLALCCSNLAAMNNLHKSLESVGRHYSMELKSVLLFLITKPFRTIQQLLDTIGSKLLGEVDAMHYAVDRLESELMSELENGRLVRLLCKFGFINERPEFDRDPRWSETGDRYIIKLFRDYVFHQVDENGNPVINLSHVLVCLNKLDAGTDERLMLISRDEQSCLVVSYREVKSCIEAAFSDLARGAR